jgi:uncharacterized membrane protein YphA (DoxX/SURF4 family)
MRFKNRQLRPQKEVEFMKKTLPLHLLRIIVSVIFFTEGLLKFLWAEELGVGRFTRIGLPMPTQLAQFVAILEMVAALALVFNLFTGDAALLLLGVMLGALVTTKIPILLGHSFLGFQPAQLAHYGVLSFLHESRLDLLVIFALLVILAQSGVSWGQKE